MDHDVEALRAVQRAPLRTVRAKDLATLLAHPRRTLGRLVERGAVVRLAQGVYTAPPDGRDGREWKPTLEAAGLALATARFGERNAVLMGLGAARHWAAIPRAIGDTVVAVPMSGIKAIELHTGGTAHFVCRRLDDLDVVLEHIELGDALVTTPAQTLLDLLSRPGQGGEPDAARDAVRGLMSAVDATEFREIVSDAPRVRHAAWDVLDVLERRDAA